MSPAKEIIILGTGGNSVDILDTISEINSASGTDRYECLGFLDDDLDKQGQSLAGKNVIGPLSAAGDFPDSHFVNGIGSPSSFSHKRNVISRTGVPPERFETIVHPTAAISRLSHLGRGAVVFQNVTITSNVRIGDHVIILPNSVISHDVVIGAYTCIAAGVCISGGVSVGESCYLGTNSSLVSDISVGNGCLIGMGSVILESTPEDKVYAGNPARFIRDLRGA